MRIKAKILQLNKYDWDLEVIDEHEILIYQGDDALAFLDDMPYEANVELCRNGEVEYEE